MNRLALNALALAALLAGVALLLSATGARAADEPAAAENPYAVDFTKDMGKWTVGGAEGKQVAGEGLKLTDCKETGGPMLEGPKVDVSATPIVVIELVNGGKEPLPLSFKVKSGEKKFTDDKVNVPAGKYTFKADLTETGIDLKALDYMKLFGAGPCDLTVKTVTFTKAGTTQP